MHLRFGLIAAVALVAGVLISAGADAEGGGRAIVSRMITHDFTCFNPAGCEGGVCQATSVFTHRRGEGRELYEGRTCAFQIELPGMSKLHATWNYDVPGGWLEAEIAVTFREDDTDPTKLVMEALGLITDGSLDARRVLGGTLEVSGWLYADHTLEPGELQLVSRPRLE